MFRPLLQTVSTPKPLIQWNLGSFQEKACFSIVIPSWNNLAYLQLCVRSIRQNSTFPHQIILHINDGSDGTLEWAQKEGLAYTHSSDNIGICFALNAARALVQTDYLLYMNDDMYVCPGWDAALQSAIDAAPSPYFFLSATMIEPYPTSSLPVIGNTSFGTSIESFEEDRLLKTFHTFPKPDWSGATRPPNLVPVKLWDLVGGYSTELSPGLYTDPDFSAKLWQAGVRYFKGVGESRVYHFVSKSLGRITPNPGRKQFLKKWGLAPSTFYRYFIHKGQPFQGPLPDPTLTPSLKRRLSKDALKIFFC